MKNEFFLVRLSLVLILFGCEQQSSEFVNAFHISESDTEENESFRTSSTDSCPFDFPVAANQFDDFGKGEKDYPYFIYNARQLATINSASPTSCAKRTYYKQCANIDLSNHLNLRLCDPFWGSYDGNDLAIRNYQISGDQDYGVNRFGLFPQTIDASIHNLIWEGFSIDLGTFYTNKNNHQVGSLIGVSYSSQIKNITASGTVRTMNVQRGAQSNDIGGLVGFARGSTFKDIQGSISLETEDNGFFVAVGGLAGMLESFSRIDSVRISGNVSGTKSTGGLVGDIVNSTIAWSSHAGDVTANGRSSNFPHQHYGGGLAGSTRNISISNSYHKGNVVATGEYPPGQVGGIAGIMTSGSLKNVYAAGEVVSLKPPITVGGLVGKGPSVASNRLEIEQSFAATTFSTSNRAGFLVGFTSVPSAVVGNDNYYLDSNCSNCNRNHGTSIEDVQSFYFPNNYPISFNWPDTPNQWIFQVGDFPTF